MKVDILEEIEKVLNNEPSRIKLAPMSQVEVEREKKLADNGYEFAFGRGFASREQLIDSLPKPK